jgi:hypothetical protein
MCDVTRQNFDTLKPEMLNNINRCDFIAFDTEFSALTISEDYKTRCENVKIEIFIAAYQRTFLPALVRTYNAGLCFALLPASRWNVRTTRV